MSAITSAQAGNWSATSTWTGGVVPGNGDTVTINHNVVVDTNTIIGTSGAAGTLVVQVASGKDLNVSSGIIFTVRGDLRLENGTLTMSAGSTYTFDSSLASGTPSYKIRFGSASNQSGSKIISNGTSGSRVTFNKASGSGNGLIGRFTNGATAWCSINAAYTDFYNLGTTSIGYDNDGIEINAAGSGMEVTYSNCTFNSCGRVVTFNCAAANNMTHELCQFVNHINSSDYACWLDVAVSTTGLRKFESNIFMHDTKTPILAFATSVKNYTFKNNLLGKTVYSSGISGTGLMSDCRENIWISRTLKADSVIGEPGSTVYDCSAIGDYNGETGSLSLYAFATGSGRCTYDGFIFENLSSNIDSDLSHAQSPTADVISKFIRCICPPNASGYMSGAFTAHGNDHITLEYEHNTAVSYEPGSGTGDAFFYLGSGYAGRSGFMPSCRSNLIWAKTRPSLDGWMTWDADGTVTDIATPSGLDYNATYNLNDGTVYDSGGANGVTKRGYHKFRLSDQNIGTHDVTLTDGSNEMTQGPKFIDSTRNFATFDSAYLGHSETAWQDSHAYSVGDLVSAASSGFYNNATVNYRCIKAHTSNSASSTDGKPGSATSFRTNWELATTHRIRQAILAGTTITDASLSLSSASYPKAFKEWVKRGFAVQEPSLRAAGHDGVTIGAGDYISVQTASASPISAAFSIPAVTAISIATASSSPITASFSMPSVTASFSEHRTASLSPLSASFSVLTVTAVPTELHVASLSPVSATFSMPTVTAVNAIVLSASCSPITASFSVVNVTASAVIPNIQTADTSSIVASFYIPILFRRSAPIVAETSVGIRNVVSTKSVVVH